MPSGGPMSHGCVRLVDEDAQWIYKWADSWTMGSTGFRSGYGTVAKPGTTLIVIGDDPPGNPSTFEKNGRMPALNMVQLPAHPYDIPAGTNQQEYFDRVRGTQP